MNPFSAFSKGTNREVNCGILVLKMQRLKKAGIVYINSFAQKLLGADGVKNNNKAQLPIKIVKDLRISTLITDLIPGKSAEIESRILTSDVYIYKDLNGIVYLHFYPKNIAPKDESSTTTPPRKFIFLFDKDFSLVGMSPADRDQTLFKETELIGKKTEDVFSSEIGLAIMDGWIQARKHQKDEYNELFSDDGQQKIQFIFAYAESTFGTYYLAFLDYTPNIGNENTRYFTINDSFKVLLDELPNVVIIHQAGIIVYANEEASKMSGIPAKEMLGRNVIQQIPPEYQASVIENMGNRKDGAPVDDYQIEVYGLDGQIKTAIVRSRFVIYEDQPSSLIILNDITDMKRLESRLIHGRDEIETIINSISSGIIIIDAEHHCIQTVNKAAANLIGLPEKDIIGRECHDFVCPNKKDCCPIEKSTGAIDNSERLLKSASGICVPILKTVTKFRYNETDCYLESFVDISELKKNEEIIVRKERILSAIAELTDELLKNPDYYDALKNKLFVLGEATGVDRIYLFENDSEFAVDLYTCSQKIEWASAQAEPQINNPDLQNIPLEAIQAFIDPLTLKKPFVGIVRELEDSYTKEILQSQDIQSILVLPIFVNDEFYGFVGFDECKFERIWTEDEHSILLAFAGTLSAAIERKHLERSLKKSIDKANNASKAKSEFLANMSHEIRTPLNAVIGFTDLLLTTHLDSMQSDYLKSVNNSAILLLDLLNDILDYSKIEAGMLELFKEKTDLRTLTAQITDIVKYKAHSKQLEFLVNLDDNLPPAVFIDGVRLRQVLINLLWNAIKFTEKGEVELSITHSPHSLYENMGVFLFKVRDTGIGIAEAKQKIIFEAFAQADSSTTRKYGGTGLGLPISVNIIDKMGSELKLVSTPNVGSEFSFTLELPVFKDEMMAQSIENSIRKICIVDDNSNNLLILKTMIGNMGIAAATFSRSKDLLQALPVDVDAFIIDYEMPDMNGLELIAKLNELLPVDHKVPYMLLHSSSDEGAIKQGAEELKIKSILSKPITSAQLRRGLECLSSCDDENINKEFDQSPKISLNQSHQFFKVLLVEDNAVNMKLAVSLIKAVCPDAEVHSAVNGAEAIKLFPSVNPDIILMDIQMPVLNGYETTKKIRELEAQHASKRRIPIVALTAGVISESKEKSYEAGMDDFLTKPLLIQNIEHVFRKWILKDKEEEKESTADQKHNEMEHFDRPKLLSNTLNNEKLLQELLSISRTTFPEYGSELAAAWSRKDIVAVKENAHAIKGQAFTMQCPTLAEMARNLELQAAENNTTNMDVQVDGILKEIDLLITNYII